MACFFEDVISSIKVGVKTYKEAVRRSREDPYGINQAIQRIERKLDSIPSRKRGIEDLDKVFSK